MSQTIRRTYPYVGQVHLMEICLYAMIIPGLSEDKILEELVYDREIVAKEAKKIAKKEINRLLKQGRCGIDVDYDFNYTIHTNKNNNDWHCVVCVNMKKAPYWNHMAACKAEAANGKKEYYIVRGFSNKKPYFIRITSHALKRFKERGIEATLKIKSDCLGGDYAPLIIQQGEVIPWMKVVDPKFWSIVFTFEDNNKLTTLFRTLHGCYLGIITEHGNYEFNTFLGRKKELKKIGETEAMKLCRTAHLVLNEPIYDKSVYDLKEDDEESLKIVEYLKNYFPNKLLP